MLAGSGKITGMWKVIFTNRVLPYFNAIGHHIRQPGSAAVISLIVFFSEFIRNYGDYPNGD